MLTDGISKYFQSEAFCEDLIALINTKYTEVTSVLFLTVFFFISVTLLSYMGLITVIYYIWKIVVNFVLWLLFSPLRFIIGFFRGRRADKEE